MSNVIVIGAGGIGKRHVRCFQTIGASLGIVEFQVERRELIASRYNCPAYASLQEANLAARWDVGVIASPAPTHIPLALELVSAGSDVLSKSRLLSRWTDLKISVVPTTRKFIMPSTKLVEVPFRIC